MFFDTAGIRYEYEPHGFAISRRGRLLTNYLPDFYLPEAGHYAECKGFLYPDAFARTMLISRALAKRGADLVLLSDIPSVWASRWPCQLHLHEGELLAVPWSPHPGAVHRRAIRERSITARLLLEGFPIVVPDWSEAPLEAARFARFAATSGPRARSTGYGRREPA